MIPKLRPDLCTKLFQRVIVSCQYLYHLEGIELVSGQSVYNRFTEFGFYTPDSDPIHAMTRRFADMVSCGLLEYVKIQDGVKLYKLTDLGRRVKAHHCHIVTSLQIKDCVKNVDMPKRLKKGKSDKIRSSREESEVKSLSQQINDGLDKHYGITKVIEHTPPMQPTTLLGWIRSLFFK